jgi:hypothetical protein
MAEALFGEPALPGRAGNTYWRNFAEPAARSLIASDDHQRLLATHVAGLRATHARRPQDKELNSLISDLLAASAEFARLWEQHDVAVMRGTHKTFVHPQVGPMELECEVLLAADGEQTLILYTARPGTETAEKLQLLRVLGPERFASQPARDTL